MLSIEWGDESFLEPWDFDPLQSWIDARVVEAGPLYAHPVSAPPAAKGGS